MNLYDFLGNDGVNTWDVLGLECSEGKCCVKGVCKEEGGPQAIFEFMSDTTSVFGSALKIARFLENGTSVGGGITALGDAVNKFGVPAMAIYLRKRGDECNAKAIAESDFELCAKECDHFYYLADSIATIYN